MFLFKTYSSFLGYQRMTPHPWADKFSVLPWLYVLKKKPSFENLPFKILPQFKCWHVSPSDILNDKLIHEHFCTVFRTVKSMQKEKNKSRYCEWHKGSDSSTELLAIGRLYVTITTWSFYHLVWSILHEASSQTFTPYLLTVKNEP